MPASPCRRRHRGRQPAAVVGDAEHDASCSCAGALRAPARRRRGERRWSRPPGRRGRSPARPRGSSDGSDPSSSRDTCTAPWRSILRQSEISASTSPRSSSASGRSSRAMRRTSSRLWWTVCDDLRACAGARSPAVAGSTFGAQRDGGQGLADLVVQLAGDAQPLGLLCGERALGALAPLGLDPIEHRVERLGYRERLTAGPAATTTARWPGRIGSISPISVASLRSGDSTRVSSTRSTPASPPARRPERRARVNLMCVWIVAGLTIRMKTAIPKTSALTVKTRQRIDTATGSRRAIDSLAEIRRACPIETPRSFIVRDARVSTGRSSCSGSVELASGASC